MNAIIDGLTFKGNAMASDDGNEAAKTEAVPPKTAEDPVRPGVTILPDGGVSPDEAAAQSSEEPVNVAVAEEPASEAPEGQPEEGSGVGTEQPMEPFRWEASEYVHHHKGPGWYFALAGFVGILLLVAVLTGQWFSLAVFLVMGLAVAVYAGKPPQTLLYEINDSGITIEGKLYGYELFRSFGVLSETEWHAIDLEPTKRFMNRMTILFTDEDFDEIVGRLGTHLPRVDRKPDAIERLSRALRF